MLELQHISYAVGKRHILNDASLQAKPGEIVVIAGANGAGKSTLIKIASGSLNANKGSIHINGKELNSWKASDLAQFTAVLQQQTILTLPFTVSEVVMMGRYPHYKKEPQDIDRSIVKEALYKAGIEHFADRNYLALSGGEQQRVHLARVFAQIWQANSFNTRYLFMDEPSNNLDIRHQHNMLFMAREFANEGNVVVAVLHDLNLAMQYADKVLLLKHGNSVAFGTPKEVFREDIMSHAFEYPIHILQNPAYSHPIIIPSVTIS
ncbi:MAG: heme ABC transporter ATP-binding protein [Sphingobacteriales bacterium]|nr:MAG: heme ABC transporter ATP-binding protein [Sphingobacteriales bacterium]